MYIYIYIYIYMIVETQLVRYMYIQEAHMAFLKVFSVV